MLFLNRFFYYLFTDIRRHRRAIAGRDPERVGRHLAARDAPRGRVDETVPRWTLIAAATTQEENTKIKQEKVYIQENS